MNRRFTYRDIRDSARNFRNVAVSVERRLAGHSKCFSNRDVRSMMDAAADAEMNRSGRVFPSIFRASQTRTARAG